MACLLFIALAVTLASAAPPSPRGYSKDVSYTQTYTYRGKYEQKCYSDGLYYMDARAFVYCSNGNPSVQPCAAGAENRPYGDYRVGAVLAYSDFCGVNLVDHDYVARNPGYNKGYGPAFNPSYGPVKGYAAEKTEVSYGTKDVKKEVSYERRRPAPGYGGEYARKEVSYERRQPGYGGYAEPGYARTEVTYERKEPAPYAPEYPAAGYARKEVSYERKEAAPYAPEAGYARKEVAYERRDAAPYAGPEYPEAGYARKEVSYERSRGYGYDDGYVGYGYGYDRRDYGPAGYGYPEVPRDYGYQTYGGRYYD